MIRGVRTVLLFVLVLAGACDSGRPESDAWNVVLVVIDTLRADHLGLYGYDRDTSPRLEALASEGVVFERAIAAVERLKVDIGIPARMSDVGVGR